MRTLRCRSWQSCRRGRSLWISWGWTVRRPSGGTISDLWTTKVTCGFQGITHLLVRRARSTSRERLRLLPDARVLADWASRARRREINCHKLQTQKQRLRQRARPNNKRKYRNKAPWRWVRWWPVLGSKYKQQWLIYWEPPKTKRWLAKFGEPWLKTLEVLFQPVIVRVQSRQETIRPL